MTTNPATTTRVSPMLPTVVMEIARAKLNTPMAKVNAPAADPAFEVRAGLLEELSHGHRPLHASVGFRPVMVVSDRYEAPRRTAEEGGARWGLWRR